MIELMLTEHRTRQKQNNTLKLQTQNTESPQTLNHQNQQVHSVDRDQPRLETKRSENIIHHLYILQFSSKFICCIFQQSPELVRRLRGELWLLTLASGLTISPEPAVCQLQLQDTCCLWRSALLHLHAHTHTDSNALTQSKAKQVLKVTGGYRGKCKSYTVQCLNSTDTRFYNCRSMIEAKMSKRASMFR